MLDGMVFTHPKLKRFINPDIKYIHCKTIMATKLTQFLSNHFLLNGLEWPCVLRIAGSPLQFRKRQNIGNRHCFSTGSLNEGEG